MYLVKSWLSPEAEEECAMCGLANHHNTKSLITGCQKKVNLETVPVLSCAISRLNLHDSIISCWEYSADPPRSGGDPTQSHHTSRGQDGGLQSPRLSSLRALGGCPHISAHPTPHRANKIVLKMSQTEVIHLSCNET